MRGTSILVATSADFAALRGGRPVASGAWDDVVRARAYRHPAPGGAVHLALRLRDGSEFVADEDSPGWDDLVDAAASALPGMPGPRAWWPPGADGAVEVAVFERPAGGR
jgi:hypothetical protein